jgi:hypothetical protein
MQQDGELLLCRLILHPAATNCWSVQTPSTLVPKLTGVINDAKSFMCKYLSKDITRGRFMVLGCKVRKQIVLNGTSNDFNYCSHRNCDNKQIM